MITPDELRRRSERLAEAYLDAWCAGTADSMFPLPVRAGLEPSGSLADVGAWVRELRASSKAEVGRGYSLELKEVGSRKYGTNRFPTRIYFETAEDLLWFAGKITEFERTAAVLFAVTRAFPQLTEWVRRNRSFAAGLHDVVGGLIEVTQYLCRNPRPNVFARELPVPVHSKFVEDHERVLREWLDRVLPASSITADDDHFARRFGLKYIETMAWVRLLDRAHLHSLRVPSDVVGLTLSDIASLDLSPDARLLIVENKVNLMTLPTLPRTLAVGGLGNAAVEVARMPLAQSRELVYWGDIDAHGLEILDRVRKHVPRTQSVFMDVTTLDQYYELAGEGPATKLRDTPSLSDPERTAYERCVTQRVRLEQERIPHPEVLRVINSLA